MFVFQFDRGYRRLNTTLKNRSKVPNTVDSLQVFCKNHPHVLCHVEMSYLVVGRFRSWNLRIRLSWWPPPGTLLSALVNIGPHDFKIHYARREKLSSYPLARSSPWPMWDPESLHTPPPRVTMPSLWISHAKQQGVTYRRPLLSEVGLIPITELEPLPSRKLSILVNIGPHGFKTRHVRWRKPSSYLLGQMFSLAAVGSRVITQFNQYISSLFPCLILNRGSHIDTYPSIY